MNRNRLGKCSKPIKSLKCRISSGYKSLFIAVTIPECVCMFRYYERFFINRRGYDTANLIPRIVNGTSLHDRAARLIII